MDFKNERLMMFEEEARNRAKELLNENQVDLLTNHILIEVINNDGDLKLTKFRNPQAMWITNDYPDEYVFRDVDIVNIFQLIQENKQLKDKLSKIETLIINHNCDTGDIYYKYNSKFLKSELKQRILEIVYEQGSDNQ